MRPVWKLGMLGLIVIGRVLAGCDRRRDEPRHRRWSRIPTGAWICPSFCRRSAPAWRMKAVPAVAVTKAWPIASGLTGVRVQKANGDRVDCIATENGRGVLLTEPVRTASRLEGERDPLFTRRRRQAAASILRRDQLGAGCERRGCRLAILRHLRRSTAGEAVSRDRPAKPAVEIARPDAEKTPDRERQPGDKFSGENRRRSRPRPDQLVGSDINT